jgi:protease-4
MHPLLYEAMERVGVKMHVTKSHDLKDMGSMFRMPTVEEERKEKELVDDLYDQFIEVIAEGRRMDKARVREVATGEIFTARRGKELGLIDDLGDLDHAIDVAAEMGNTPRHPVWVHPKRTLRDLVSSFAGATLIDPLIERLEERLFARYEIQHRI